jgi:mevalonate kinase
MKKPTDLHANGKLLITGEYLVLKGAKALALPVRFGQKLQISKTENQIIDWESTSPEGTWYRGKFDIYTLEILKSDDMPISQELKKLFVAARKLNINFLKEGGCHAKIHADYPLEWGLGSSSTLCYLVAQWAGVDAYELFRLTSQGSGYDIACAGQKELLYYQLKEGLAEVALTNPGKALRENSYFVYLGKKQNTQQEVNSFLSDSNYSETDVEQISRLASFICLADTAAELIELVDEHEKIMSKILQRNPIAKQFPYFPGTVKSLGAWGGDFAMFVSEEPRETISEILSRKGYSTLFSFTEMEVKS